jgi:hypothetical protein
MFRPLKTTAMVCVLGLGMLATAPAVAYHRHGGAHFGFYLGVPLYAPYPRYDPPPYYYYAPPAVVYATPPAPPVYIERGDLPAPSQPAQATPPSSAYWYYCPDSKAYYPHVRKCASPWQPVSPQPPSAGK